MKKRTPPLSTAEFIERLKEYGELVEINEETDWNLETSAFLAQTYRIGGPAILFNKLKGYQDNHKLAGGLYAGQRKQPWRRMAIALGLDPDISYEEWSNELLMRVVHPIKPTIVATGPCKEEIHVGKEVNIFEFPLPYIHNGDGGRYGGTLSAIITKDPDSDWVNWGMYRWMAHTRNKLGGDFQVGQHMPDMYYEYERRGEAMPFCIAIGGAPAITMCAGLSVPKGISEVDVAGGLLMQPVELVRAETNNLLVPAHAEIVIEGEVRPYERYDEGPFGEYDGFMNTPRRPEPVYRINCITHKKNTIWHYTAEGLRFNDSGTVPCATWGPLFTAMLRMGGFRDFKHVYAFPEAEWVGICLTTGVPYEAYVGELSDALWSLGFMSYFDKMWFLDKDVDVLDTSEILEYFFNYLRPDRIYRSAEHKGISNICAWSTLEDKIRGKSTAVTYDATTHPTDKPRQKIKVENLYSASKLEAFEKKWNEIGVGVAFKHKKEDYVSRLV